MMIHKIIPSVDYNYWLKRLNTQLSEPTNQNSIKSPQSFLRSLQRIRKHYHKTLGTKVINIPMSPPSPTTILFFFRERGDNGLFITLVLKLL